MTRGDIPDSPVQTRSPGKHLPEWEALICDIVVTKCPRLVGIIEDDEPPFPLFGLLAARNESHIGRNTPCRSKMGRDLLLQRRDRFRHIFVRPLAALVDAGDLDFCHDSSFSVSHLCWHVSTEGGGLPLGFTRIDTAQRDQRQRRSERTFWNQNRV